MEQHSLAGSYFPRSSRRLVASALLLEFGYVGIMQSDSIHASVPQSLDSYLAVQEQVAIVPLDEHGLTDNDLASAKAIMSRDTNGMINLEFTRIEPTPEQIAEIGSVALSQHCAGPDAQLPEKARSVLKVPKDTALVVTTSLEGCGDVGIGDASRYPTNINIRDVDSHTEDLTRDIMLHELGHGNGLGHQGAVDMVNNPEIGYDWLYEEARKGSHIDLTKPLQTHQLMGYGVNNSCNIMGRSELYCGGEFTEMTPMQYAYLAKEMGKTPKDLTVIDLAKANDSSSFSPDKKWIAEIELPWPIVTTEINENGTTEKTYQTLNIVPKIYHDNEIRMMELYASNSNNDRYETIFIGAIPVQPEYLDDRIGPVQDRTTIALNGINLTFLSNGMIKTTIDD